MTSTLVPGARTRLAGAGHGIDARVVALGAGLVTLGVEVAVPFRPGEVVRWEAGGVAHPVRVVDVVDGLVRVSRPEGAMNADGRLGTRVAVAGAVWLRLPDGRRVGGRLVDLSVTGARLAVTGAPTLHPRDRVVVVIAGHDLDAEVVRVGPRAADNSRQYGVRFRAPTPAARREVASVVTAARLGGEHTGPLAQGLVAPRRA